ncbi:MAG TPA: isoprenylcysteine carboxylmethyltransferase family protein [Vicinamibacterales bacterium]
MSAPRTAVVFVWLGALSFACALAVFVHAYFVRYSAVGPPPAPAAALAIDVALFTGFALHHSVFARLGVRRAVASLVHPGLERSVYVWVASALFIAVCVLWQPLPGRFYRHDGMLAAIHWAIVAAGAWLTWRSAQIIDPLELAGVRQLRGTDRPTTFRVEGPYRFVRHPIYLGWILLVFGVPEMTGTRLAFAAISSAYLVIAIPLEEQTLRTSEGDAYARYAQTVRWRLVPGVW